MGRFKMLSLMVLGVFCACAVLPAESESCGASASEGGVQLEAAADGGSE